MPRDCRVFALLLVLIIRGSARSQYHRSWNREFYHLFVGINGHADLPVPTPGHSEVKMQLFRQKSIRCRGPPVVRKCRLPKCIAPVYEFLDLGTHDIAIRTSFCR